MFRSQVGDGPSVRTLYVPCACSSSACAIVLGGRVIDPRYSSITPIPSTPCICRWCFTASGPLIRVHGQNEAHRLAAISPLLCPTSRSRPCRPRRLPDMPIASLSLRVQAGHLRKWGTSVFRFVCHILEGVRILTAHHVGRQGRYAYAVELSYLFHRLDSAHAAMAAVITTTQPQERGPDGPEVVEVPPG